MKLKINENKMRKIKLRKSAYRLQKRKSELQRLQPQLQHKVMRY